MSERAREEAAEEEEAVPRRDPSEKQEPHTVMWGKSVEWQTNMVKWEYVRFQFQNHGQ